MNGELLKKIQNIQNHLYGVCNNEISSNNDWINVRIFLIKKKK